MTDDPYYPLFAGGARLTLRDLDTARSLVEDAVLDDGHRAAWSPGVPVNPATPRLSLWFHVDGEVARVRLIGGLDGVLYVDVPFGDEGTGAPEALSVPADRVFGPREAPEAHQAPVLGRCVSGNPPMSPTFRCVELVRAATLEMALRSSAGMALIAARGRPTASLPSSRAQAADRSSAAMPAAATVRSGSSRWPRT